jgi:type II secretory pathway pseudopilin PulG
MRRAIARCPSVQLAQSAAANPCFVAPRRALTLLEVVISLAIFLFSLAAISQLIRFASELAVDAQQRSYALFLCEEKLAEAASGVLPVDASSTETAFEPALGVPEGSVDERTYYQWFMDSEAGEVPGLYNVTVTVTRVRGNGSKLEVQLNQMIFDPSLRGTSVPPPAATTTTPATTTPTTGGNAP